MKIQELAIIFIIIILPISLLLSEYTQFQIKTISLQTEYDAKLTAATYDAIKAFQLNTTNSTTSDLANSRMRDLEASINSFRNSLMSGFKLNGYTEEELNNYIPALVYTLYDGFYIYSPYENINHRYQDPETGEIITKAEPNIYDKAEENGAKLYGIKPFINYSCRYKMGNTDVVITYALDNYVTVKGTINGEFVNKGGYLIDGITYDSSTGIVTYNGIEIKTEHLKEKLLGKLCSYVRVNGTKYYLLEDYFENDDGSKYDAIVYVLNGELTVQTTNPKEVTAWKLLMENNDTAITYYREAYEFTKWFKEKNNLRDLTYGDAVDENGAIDEETGEIKRIWKGDTTKIFDFNSGGSPNNNIENELSNFNQHRLAVIRHKIETNLAIAISNYNIYSGAADFNVFQMPELKENEWDDITHNISIISFLQGLHIGGKIYNGYTVVTNTQSNEVVMEDDIYYLGTDNYYHKMGDKELEDTGSIDVSASDYGNETLGCAGRLNLDFERAMIRDPKKNETYYYYTLEKYNASYDSVVMQNNVTNYDDIYQYVNEQKTKGNLDLVEAFYTALARERYSAYRATNEVIDFYSVLFVGVPNNHASFDTLGKYYANQLNEVKGIMVKYITKEMKENSLEATQYIIEQKDKYHLIIVDSHVWTLQIQNHAYDTILEATNLFTISNDAKSYKNDSGIGLKIFKSSSSAGSVTRTATPQMTELGIEQFDETSITPFSDAQWHFKFDKDNYDIDVFYTTTYNDGVTGECDYIGCLQNTKYKWMHSQLAFRYNNNNDMKLFKQLIYYILSNDTTKT